MDAIWWAGGFAALGTGILAAGWSYLRSAWSRFSSHFIVTCTVENMLMSAVQMYCLNHFRRSPFGHRAFIGWLLFVRRSRRTQLVAVEDIGKAGVVYWNGWRPIWIRKEEATKDSPTARLTISFVRGMFDCESLIERATAHFNRLDQNVNDKNERRHCIRHIVGVGRSHNDVRTDENRRAIYANPPGISDKGDFMRVREHRLIGDLTANDIGPLQTSVNAIDLLALSDDAGQAIEEARHWKDSEQWYRDHQLPWRRGWLLYGEPGNGKTALARALAETLDLPVFVFDLSSLSNSDMRWHWSQMLSSVPCMAVIEDIDAVFDGRKSLNGELTFDCLLNCFDGLDRSDGLFLIVTTNKVESLDGAIGIPSESDPLISTRPGRIDRVIEMRRPGREGRMKIAQRILAEWHLCWERVVDEGDNDTGAQFQERCGALALQLYWEDRQDDSDPLTTNHSLLTTHA